MNGHWSLAQNVKSLLKHCRLLYYEQRSCIMQWRNRERPDHTQSFRLDSLDTKNWSLKWSLMRFGWTQVASPGECVWFSSCVLCIFIGYRVRMTLIMYGLNFSPGYIWVFNCPGEKKKTFYRLSRCFLDRHREWLYVNPSSAEPIWIWRHFCSPQRWPQIDHRVKF